MGEGGMCYRPIFLLFTWLMGYTLAQNRIVGGDEISIANVPYMLSFRLKDKHICGASIIDEEWGATAAHCAVLIMQHEYKDFTVLSGTDDLEKGGTVHNVTYISWHDEYDSTNSDYDIAVFEVTPIFEFGYATQSVKLPGGDFHAIDLSWGLVAGWGFFLSSDDPVVSEKLQYVILPWIQQEVCIWDYGSRFRVTPRQLCYGYQVGVEDTCRGDSGGPLVNKENILIGITSWGDGCGERYSPGVYTNVMYVAEWIKREIGIE